MKNLILFSLLLSLFSCAGKAQPIKHNPIEVYVTNDSNKFNTIFLEHVLTQTNKLCAEVNSYTQRVVIKNINPISTITYQCIGNVDKVRTLEEVIDNTREIHYKSFLSVILGY